MKQNELEQLSGDELWALRVKIDEALATKLAAEKNVHERRLRQLNGEIEPERRSQASERRPYPAVLPKFRNPDDPSQTWAGRGKQPRWLKALIKSGNRIDQFRI